MRCGNADQLFERLGVEGIEKRTDNGIYIVMREWCNWLTRVPYKHESLGSSPSSRTIIMRDSIDLQ